MAATRSSTTRQPTFQEIAERAYARYLERGRQPGQDVEDWLEAERELGDGPARTSGTKVARPAAKRKAAAAPRRRSTRQ